MQENFSLEKVCNFWFEELTPKDWFSNNPELDARIREHFLSTHAFVARGDSADWCVTPLGRLAEIIVLDQFSRNMFRNTPQAFVHDADALQLAEEAIAQGADKEVPESHRAFMYMPYMHSESATVHGNAVLLFSSLEDQSSLRYELLHKEIIDRFGRYPHRNSILGRTSTPEEIEFLQAHKGF